MMSEKGESRPIHVEVSRTTRLHFDIDDEKAEAIRSCLKNGRLSISINEVDLSRGGRFENGYQYD
jgi:hypothetical protein